MPNIIRGMMGAAGVSVTYTANVTPGAMFVWGRGAQGQLGLGSDVLNRSSPTQIGSLTTWKTGAGSNFGAHAVKSDGTLWGWGRNDSGFAKIGDGTVITKSSPVQIGSLTDWSKIAAASIHVLAIKTDGTLWAWGQQSGANYRGIVGDGTIINRSSPVQIGALTTWSAIACSNGASAGIRTDGKLFTWGDGLHGANGRGSVVDISSPVQVGSLTDWSKISASNHGFRAVKTDGTLWVWGRNYVGQLGIGTVVDTSSPVQVGSLTDWSHAGQSSNASNVMLIKTDGTLWGVGSNSEGWLGDGTVVFRSSPVQIGTLKHWHSVSTTGLNTVAVQTNGTLWSWGSDYAGKRGAGTNEVAISSPVQVGSLTTWAETFAMSQALGAIKGSAP
jgi:alpha-tubulin suppressor-like RCC1 family protein